MSDGPEWPPDTSWIEFETLGWPDPEHPIIGTLKILGLMALAFTAVIGISFLVCAL